MRAGKLARRFRIGALKASPLVLVGTSYGFFVVLIDGLRLPTPWGDSLHFPALAATMWIGRELSQALRRLQDATGSVLGSEPTDRPWWSIPLMYLGGMVAFLAIVQLAAYMRAHGLPPQ